MARTPLRITSGPDEMERWKAALRIQEIIRLRGGRAQNLVGPTPLTDRVLAETGSLIDRVVTATQEVKQSRFSPLLEQVIKSTGTVGRNPEGVAPYANLRLSQVERALEGLARARLLGSNPVAKTASLAFLLARLAQPRKDPPVFNDNGWQNVCGRGADYDILSHDFDPFGCEAAEYAPDPTWTGNENDVGMWRYTGFFLSLHLAVNTQRWVRIAEGTLNPPGATPDALPPGYPKPGTVESPAGLPGNWSDFRSTPSEVLQPHLWPQTQTRPIRFRPPSYPTFTRFDGPTRARPGRRTKLSARYIGVRVAAHIITESRDAIACLWHHIPANSKRYWGNPTLGRMISDISNFGNNVQWTPWAEVNVKGKKGLHPNRKALGDTKGHKAAKYTIEPMAGALYCLAVNAAEDAVYGALSRAERSAARVNTSIAPGATQASQHGPVIEVPGVGLFRGQDTGYRPSGTLPLARIRKAQEQSLGGSGYPSPVTDILGPLLLGRPIPPKW